MTAVSVIIVPTDRSIPPEMMTKVHSHAKHAVHRRGLHDADHVVPGGEVGRKKAEEAQKRDQHHKGDCLLHGCCGQKAGFRGLCLSMVVSDIRRISRSGR